MTATTSREHYATIPFEEFVNDFAIFACKWSARVQAVLCENIRAYFEDKTIVQLVKVYVNKKAVYERNERTNFENVAKGFKGYEIQEVTHYECDAYFQVLTDILVHPILRALDENELKE